jgi:hypothetical protein
VAVVWSHSRWRCLRSCLANHGHHTQHSRQPHRVHSVYADRYETVVSQSVVKQIGAAPIFTRLQNFYPVWQSYTHTGPGVLSNGTTTKKRWDATLCRTSSQGHAKHGPQVVLLRDCGRESPDSSQG